MGIGPPAAPGGAAEGAYASNWGIGRIADGSPGAGATSGGGPIGAPHMMHAVTPSRSGRWQTAQSTRST
jgi:hypothetical protein